MIRTGKPIATALQNEWNKYSCNTVLFIFPEKVSSVISRFLSGKNKKIPVM